MENKESPGFWSTAWDMLTGDDTPTATPGLKTQASKPQTLTPQPSLAAPANQQAVQQKQEAKDPFYYAFVHRAEGFKPKAYKAPEGHWTVGPGLRFNPITKKPIQEGDVMNEEESRAGMIHWVDNVVVPNLKKNIPGWDKLDEQRKTAIISFAYNSGQNFMTSSKYPTIQKLLKEGKWFEAGDAMMLYNKHAEVDKNGNPIKGPDGKPVMVESKGLTNRRRRERALMQNFGGFKVPWEEME